MSLYFYEFFEFAVWSILTRITNLFYRSLQTSKLNLIKTTTSSSKLLTSATSKTTTTKEATTTIKLPPLFDGILQPPILEGKNAGKLTLSEPKLKYLRRGILGVINKNCFKYNPETKDDSA